MWTRPKMVDKETYILFNFHAKESRGIDFKLHFNCCKIRGVSFFLGLFLEKFRSCLKPFLRLVCLYIFL